MTLLSVLYFHLSSFFLDAVTHYVDDFNLHVHLSSSSSFRLLTRCWIVCVFYFTRYINPINKLFPIPISSNHISFHLKRFCSNCWFIPPLKHTSFPFSDYHPIFNPFSQGAGIISIAPLCLLTIPP